jgi:hypothetical protein
MVVPNFTEESPVITIYFSLLKTLLTRIEFSVEFDSGGHSGAR